MSDDPRACASTGSTRRSELDLVHPAVAPILPELMRTDDGMAAVIEVGPCMLAFRFVAAAHVTAGQAES